MHSPTKHLLLLASLASLAATQDYEAEYEEDPNAIEGLPASAADLLDAPYDYGFNCDQQDAGYGYYADVNNGCKVFHICVPIYDNEGALTRSQHGAPEGALCHSRVLHRDRWRRAVPQTPAK